MCEPHHSIVQYPDEDDRGPTGPRIEALPDLRTPPKGLRTKFVDFLKKFGSWFHLSRMGSGHSEAVGYLSPLAREHFMPSDTKYEAEWWVRRVRLDGPYNGGYQYDAAEALKCATTYAHRVSIGSLPLVRQFLESSMRCTERPVAYLTRFMESMASPKGRDLLWAKMKLIFGVKMPLYIASLAEKVKPKCDAVIKAVMGITRRRDNLVPEWGDDDKLWVPQKTLVFA